MVILLMDVFSEYNTRFQTFDRYLIQILTHLKFGLATATLIFKWLKNFHCLFWDQPFANIDVHFIPNISDLID